MSLEHGWKMRLGCGKEVKERKNFPKVSDNMFFFVFGFFFWKNPLMWPLTWMWMRAIWA